MALPLSLFLMTKEGEEFPGHLFPHSYTLLYCPLNDCTSEKPFCHAHEFVEHLLKVHGIQVLQPEVVLPFLDRYLEEKGPFTRGASLGGDQELRERLQQERLLHVLQIQAHERFHSHRQQGSCIFCEVKCVDKRALLYHMYSEHGFNIGLLDNLVMLDAFLEQLTLTFQANQCIYCQKEFPTKGILRRHMRTKGHYRIRPDDHRFDRHYLINYVQAGKTWSTLPKDELNEEADEAGWSDLDETIDRPAPCLFCDEVLANAELCLEHLTKEHDFDLLALQEKHQLDFYGGLRILNYLRTWQSTQQCPSCNEPHFDCFEKELKGALFRTSEALLKPVIEEDPLIEVLLDE